MGFRPDWERDPFYLDADRKIAELGEMIARLPAEGPINTATFWGAEIDSEIGAVSRYLDRLRHARVRVAEIGDENG